MESLESQLAAAQAALACRDAEVAALREIAEAASELQSADAQAAKVIELSKKNRALNLQLEREKTKVAKLQQALSIAAASSGEKVASDDRNIGSVEASAGIARELAINRERLQQMTTRLGTMEQKVFLLDTENKRLTRALVREVGEDVPLARVLDEGSDWRGRREQIVHLRDTIRALREATAQAGGSDSAAAGLLARHDAAHRSAIGRANKERVRETERMMSELEAARKSAEDLRLQYTGACSRRKVVETELAGLRNKLAIVLAKTQTDDKLIAALRAEVARCSSASTTDTSSSNRERQELRAQVTQLQSRLDQQLHVIGCLQAERRTGLASDSSQLEELAKENAELRLLAGGTADALGRQVIALQCENMALRAQLLGGEDASVQQRLELSPAQLTVLQDAREASAAGAAG